MKHRGLWSNKRPSAAALASTEPFACDSLSFNQWLQFIFIPRFKALILNHRPLPATIAISPAAQVWLADEVAIQKVLTEIDQTVAANASGNIGND
ncbi:YqcC family protein [Alteromonas sp. MYP5]|uniref:YqcC family protein n=2 Tax=Alteromonas ponticola TaxID=2720613 RepID=A0ABX1R2P3_9ALTE|nr:YqcC family protein [Alteromonas ponticola]NMH59721.1 YqcC family protein [Alteromonas ponticola]